jgi:hypothetical protein
MDGQLFQWARMVHVPAHDGAFGSTRPPTRYSTTSSEDVAAFSLPTDGALTPLSYLHRAGNSLGFYVYIDKRMRTGAMLCLHEPFISSSSSMMLFRRQAIGSSIRVTDGLTP